MAWAFCSTPQCQISTPSVGYIKINLSDHRRLGFVLNAMGSMDAGKESNHDEGSVLQAQPNVSRQPESPGKKLPQAQGSKSRAGSPNSRRRTGSRGRSRRGTRKRSQSRRRSKGGRSRSQSRRWSRGAEVGVVIGDGVGAEAGVVIGDGAGGEAGVGIGDGAGVEVGVGIGDGPRPGAEAKVGTGDGAEVGPGAGGLSPSLSPSLSLPSLPAKIIACRELRRL